MDMSLLSNEAVLGYMVGGIYYDAVKTTAVSNFIAIKEKSITPTCLPINNPVAIPKVIGWNIDVRASSLIGRPALKKANRGKIKNDTQGWSLYSNVLRGDWFKELIFNGIKDASNIPEIVACIPDFKKHNHKMKPKPI